MDILHFSGLPPLDKVIAGLALRVTAAEAGFGVGTTKAVYLRKSEYQSASVAPVLSNAGYSAPPKKQPSQPPVAAKDSRSSHSSPSFVRFIQRKKNFACTIDKKNIMS